VIASDVTADETAVMNLEGLAPGQYRVMVSPRSGRRSRRAEVSQLRVVKSVTVKADDLQPLNYHLVPRRLPHSIRRMIGLNAELSTVPLPLEPGKRVKIYLAGEGVDQVPGTSIAVNSPFFVVDPASLVREQLERAVPGDQRRCAGCTQCTVRRLHSTDAIELR
jgi:hypothetical protein